MKQRVNLGYNFVERPFCTFLTIFRWRLRTLELWKFEDNSRHFWKSLLRGGVKNLIRLTSLINGTSTPSSTRYLNSDSDWMKAAKWKKNSDENLNIVLQNCNNSVTWQLHRLYKIICLHIKSVVLNTIKARIFTSRLADNLASLVPVFPA